MGVERSTETDAKAETGGDTPPPPPERPDPPVRYSRLESRAAARRPPESETRETPPPAQSARADKSNDPNDDPNRVGTPRADSRRMAAERNAEAGGEPSPPPLERSEAPARYSRLESRAAARRPPESETREVPAQGARAEKSDDSDDDPGAAGTPRADSRRTAAEENAEPAGELNGTEPRDRQAPTTDRADDDSPQTREDERVEPDSRDGERPAAEARGPAGTDDRTTDREPTSGTGAPGHEGPSPATDGPAADDAGESTRESDGSAEGTRPNEAEAEGPDTPSPGSEAPAAGEERIASDDPVSNDGTPEPDGEDHGQEPADRTADGRENDPSPEEPEAEPPVRETTEEAEPLADDRRHGAPEGEPPEDDRAQETPDETTGESDADDEGPGTESAEPGDPYANLPTRADLDPVGAGIWTAERGDLDPVDENQDLREPDPERDSPLKRALRGMSNDTEDALKHANRISDDLQKALGDDRPPSGFPTATREAGPTVSGVDNTVQIPSVLVGVVSGAIVIHSVVRGVRGLATGVMRRNNDR